MKTLWFALALVASVLGFSQTAFGAVPVTDSHLVFSPYNWYRSGSEYAQTPNPGAYLKLGFSGTKISVMIDVSPLTKANVPSAQYPFVRYSVDGKAPTSLQLSASTASLECAKGLPAGIHTLLLQYVAGYVFLDFWTPVNVLRVTGFELDEAASLTAPVATETPRGRNALFLGDSITNGDDDTATFAGGISNAVDTQDATVGYPSVVAAGIEAEYGVVAYGGGSWDGTAADGHTPGLLSFSSMMDSLHSRLVAGKFFPVPDDVFVNMGENSGPAAGDVVKLVTNLRTASSAHTNLFLIVPFSGRARSALLSGFNEYRKAMRSDERAYLLDLGDNPYLRDAGPTMLSVDGQHPLATLHGQLGARIVQARAKLLSGRKTVY